MGVESRKSLADWGVTKLATVAYATLTLLIAAMALAAWLATQRVEIAFADYREHAREGVATAQATGLLAQVDAAQFTWRLDPDADNAAAFDAALGRLSAHLATMPALVAEDLELAERAEAARAGAAALSAAFGRMVAGEADHAAAIAAMRAAAATAVDAAHAVEDAAVAAGSPRAVLAAATAVERLLDAAAKLTDLHGEPAAAAAGAAILAEFDAAAAALGETPGAAPQPVTDALAAALAAFRAEAGRVIAVEQAMAQTVGADLAPAREAVRAAVEAVLAGQTAARAILGPEAQAGLVTASRLMLALGALALVVAVGLGALARWRNQYSLEGVIAKLERLAAGDLDVEFYDIDRPNEIGRMAKALNWVKIAARDAIEATEAEAANAAKALRLQEALAGVVSAAAAGDFSARIHERFDNPEYDALAEAANALVASVDSGLAEAGRVLEALARRDLSRSMQGAYHGAFARLQADINTTVATMGEVLGELAAVSRDVDAAAQQIASGARTVSTQAEQQAAALEETAAAMEQISASVAATAAGSREAAGMSNQAASRAGEGVRIVAGVDTAMREIEAGAEKVKEIISAIDSIAFTTNLLALNASVEAARAGEAGKGFAVVASEVRSLAQRSASAAGEIRRLIEASGASVVAGVDRVREAREALDKIMEGVTAVEGSIRDISTAAAEQASGVAEVTRRLQGMDQITQSNAAMAEESAANASELVDLSGRLRDLSESFEGAAGASRTRRRAA